MCGEERHFLLLLHPGHHCCLSLKKTCFTVGFAEVLWCPPAGMRCWGPGALLLPPGFWVHMPTHTFTSPNWPRIIWCHRLSPWAWSSVLSVSTSDRAGLLHLTAIATAIMLTSNPYAPDKSAQMPTILWPTWPGGGQGDGLPSSLLPPPLPAPKLGHGEKASEGQKDQRCPR